MQFRNLKLASVLGWQDVRQAYRRSVFGPFWLTAGMLVQIATMGLVFGLIFKTELGDYLPFLAIGIMFWGLISNSVIEGCQTFISSDSMIRQLNLDHSVYVARTLWRNLVTAAHNFAILPLVLLVFLRWPGLPLLSFIPGFALLVLNLGWIIWLLGTLSARFRDMPPIISSLMTITFYLTPVMWYPKLIDNNSLAHLLLGLNPMYHLLQIVRLPLLGEWPTWENWCVATFLCAVGWITNFYVQKKFRDMIAYWV